MREEKLKKQYFFDQFRLDTVNQCLWRDHKPLNLTPKDFAVLLYLVEEQGRLVTKDELIEAIWPDTNVTDAVLKVSIGNIRKALGDNPATPHFIETAHRRGYKFIRQVSAKNNASEISTVDRKKLHSPIGREAEMARLQEWLEKALLADRQIVFITGEAGIGKTTLVEAFLQQTAAGGTIETSQGHCLEQYGSGEAYMPVLEALNKLCRRPGFEHLIELLRRYAPTWLAQIPWVVSTNEREALQREILGATRERMLREMAELIEALTAETPLVLVLEDLHWSDYSTLDLISHLARRREPAKLMLIGTYRPLDAIMSRHPLKAVQQELQMHKQCEELPLQYLTEGSVADYIESRFFQNDFRNEFARLIHHRTDGTPLFMVNLVDYLLSQGLIVQLDGEWRLKTGLEKVEVGVPDNIRQMIEKQIDRLNEDQQRMLESAAVAGINFTAAAVAAGMGKSEVQIEELCEGLARNSQFLKRSGSAELPDSTVTGSYSFIHALYQNVFYDRTATIRRSQLHQRLGEYAETVYGDRVGEIAAELAMHFEQGRDCTKAIKYLRCAADNSTKRYANDEAIAYLRRALRLAQRLPEKELIDLKMALLEQIGIVRRSMGDNKGALEEFEAMAECARNFARINEETKALLQLCSVLFWVNRKRCLEVSDQALELSNQVNDKLLRVHARANAGNFNLLLRGWSDEDFKAITRGIEESRRVQDRPLLSLYLMNYCVQSATLRSEYESVCRTAQEAMQVSEEINDAYNYMAVQVFYIWSLLHLGRWGEMLEQIDNAFGMAGKNGHQLVYRCFELELAWLHEQLFDFDQVLKICESIFKQLHDFQRETFPQFFSLILSGLANAGLGRYDQAFDYYSEIMQRLKHKHILMDWHFNMLFRYSLSQFWFAQGEFNKSREEAEQAFNLAKGPGERTYMALSRKILAEIAIAEQNFDLAEEELSQALSILEGAEAPLAEWRVYSTAAQLYDQLKKRADADRYWKQSADVIERLANSLGKASDLREKFLANPQIESILLRAGKTTKTQRTQRILI